MAEQTETPENDSIYEMAMDIRAVDGNHDLGAAELAEKLVERGWAKPSPKDDASVDFPRLEGETIVLGPEIFSNVEGTLINWKGQNFVPQKEKDLQPPLTAYSVGERVVALKNGDWLEGSVSEKDRVSHNLHVQTERGPVTIASSRMVKKLL